MFDIMSPPENEHAFYRAYLNELYNFRVDKAALLSGFRCMIDFAETFQRMRDRVSDWRGHTLILESDDDTTFSQQSRDRLRATFPNARRHVFTGAGHSPGATRRDEYFDLVTDFLVNAEPLSAPNSLGSGHGPGAEYQPH